MNTFSRFLHSYRAFRRELIRDEKPERPQSVEAPRVGLALGGGFARGMAHIGVLKVLEDEGIPISYLAGTSVGAVIGAAYASGISPRELQELSVILKFSDFARYTLSRYGLCSSDRLAALLNRILKVKTFEELRIPFAVAATDFNTGDGVVYTTGPLIDPVRASCAYPGIFLPVEVEGRLLVDGLLTHAVPTQPLRTMGADRVIGVYLTTNWSGGSGPRHVLDIIGQCFSIAQDKMIHHWKPAADIVMEFDVTGFSYDKFDRSLDLIALGERETRKIVPQLKQWLNAGAPAAPLVENDVHAPRTLAPSVKLAPST